MREVAAHAEVEDYIFVKPRMEDLEGEGAGGDCVKDGFVDCGSSEVLGEGEVAGVEGREADEDCIIIVGLGERGSCAGRRWIICFVGRHGIIANGVVVRMSY